MEIAILLSAYNSSKYIKEQILSIQEQTYPKWKLYIRNDGSSDDTANIIKKFSLEDKRIVVINSNNIGVIKSFMWLLENTKANYYMFCDHDDVWLPNKIEMTLGAMKEAERSSQQPIIACTNLMLVDSKLQIIAKSYRVHKHYTLNMYNSKLYHLFYNNIPGCTMMINNAAKKVALPYPSNIIMHDAWIAQSTLWNQGKVIFIDKPLMLYRQHSNNAIGAPKNRSLFKQLTMIGTLMQKTKQQYVSTKGLCNMPYSIFVILKIYFLLKEHLSNIINIHKK